jgi:hypothetical protein
VPETADRMDGPRDQGLGDLRALELRCPAHYLSSLRWHVVQLTVGHDESQQGSCI